MKRMRTNFILIASIIFSSLLFSALISKLLELLFSYHIFDTMTVIGLLLIVFGACMSLAPNEFGARNSCAMSKQQSLRVNVYSISSILSGIIVVLCSIVLRQYI